MTADHTIIIRSSYDIIIYTTLYLLVPTVRRHDDQTTLLNEPRETLPSKLLLAWFDVRPRPRPCPAQE